MIGLDTNVLLRALISDSVWPDDHPGQTRAARDLVRDGGQIFYVNQIVLAETVWVLTHPMEQPRAVVLDILQALLAAANVVIDGRSAVASAVAAYRNGKPGFADHFIGHVNRMAGCETTMSFDKDTKHSPTFRRLTPRRA